MLFVFNNFFLFIYVLLVSWVDKKELSDKLFSSSVSQMMDNQENDNVWYISFARFHVVKLMMTALLRRSDRSLIVTGCVTVQLSLFIAKRSRSPEEITERSEGWVMWFSWMLYMTHCHKRTVCLDPPKQQLLPTSSERCWHHDPVKPFLIKNITF